MEDNNFLRIYIYIDSLVNLGLVNKCNRVELPPIMKQEIIDDFDRRDIISEKYVINLEDFDCYTVTNVIVEVTTSCFKQKVFLSFDYNTRDTRDDQSTTVSSTN